MPELPEIETMRAGLEKILIEQPRIEKILLNRPDIRFPIPADLPMRFLGQRLRGVRRRAKYILFETDGAILLSHLGMTGSWRIANKQDADPHDHCFIDLSDGRRLAYRDPRRFGILDLIEPGGELDHPRLKNLGVEPLNEEEFTAEFLLGQSRSKRTSIKALIMDQTVVVGIGNIYASEALFQARIRPTRRASRMTLLDCRRLVLASRLVLSRAIAAGGSSIRDYRDATGKAGSFQDQHFVYNRAGEVCRRCRMDTQIKSRVLAGRSTFWCSKCQL